MLLCMLWSLCCSLLCLLCFLSADLLSYTCTSVSPSMFFYLFFLMNTATPRSTQGWSSAASDVYKGPARNPPANAGPMPGSDSNCELEVQSLSLIHISEPRKPYKTSYAASCLKKKIQTYKHTYIHTDIHTYISTYSRSYTQRTTHNTFNNNQETHKHSKQKK